ncbi:MAG: hypothetical protein KGJ94_08855 [Xanthomonadaceae bacterium]|nr:hypothetical protein [Xanthomonadaceae bacterium]
MMMLALLAWSALALDAFAAPQAMASQGAVPTAKMAMGKPIPSASCGMAMNQATRETSPRPSQPGSMGHGCCQHGGCNCVSLCGGIASVTPLVWGWQPAHDAILLAIYVAPALVHDAPLLRPPIA